MSHEHHEHCEHQHQHEHHHLVELGSLCCRGQCSHPEHQQLGQLLEQQRYMQEQLQAIEQPPQLASLKNKEKAKKDKKAKRQQFGWAALQVA